MGLYWRAFWVAAFSAALGSRFVMPVVKKIARARVITKDHAAWIASAHTSRVMDGSAFVGLDAIPTPMEAGIVTAVADSSFPA
jgi:hypothetical protein